MRARRHPGRNANQKLVRYGLNGCCGEISSGFVRRSRPEIPALLLRVRCVRQAVRRRQGCRAPSARPCAVPRDRSEPVRRAGSPARSRPRTCEPGRGSPHPRRPRPRSLAKALREPDDRLHQIAVERAAAHPADELRSIFSVWIGMCFRYPSELSPVPKSSGPGRSQVLQVAGKRLAASMFATPVVSVSSKLSRRGWSPERTADATGLITCGRSGRGRTRRPRRPARSGPARSPSRRQGARSQRSGRSAPRWAGRRRVGSRCRRGRRPHQELITRHLAVPDQARPGRAGPAGPPQRRRIRSTR